MVYRVIKRVIIALHKESSDLKSSNKILFSYVNNAIQFYLKIRINSSKAVNSAPAQ